MRLHKLVSPACTRRDRVFRRTTSRPSRLYRRAADQGDTFAQNNLGVMYATGQAVPQDYVQAYAWFSVSLALDNDVSAKNRDKVAALMTPSQIAEAGKIASEWRPGSSPAASITIRPMKNGMPLERK